MTTHPSDELLMDILLTARSFACIGVSPDPIRPSHFVARYLSLRGYRVVPVNPNAVGTVLLGEAVRPDLASIEGQIDVLDIFRKPAAVPAIVAEGLRVLRDLRCVWLQVGIVSPEAEAMCDAAGVTIVQDRCLKIERQRLFGELRMGGFATGIVGSRLPRQT